MKAAMYFRENETLPNQEEWLRLDRPKMYKRFYSDDTVIAWDETAYGSIRIRVGNEEAEGKDMIELNGYLALGYYYTNGVSKVYKCLST